MQRDQGGYEVGDADDGSPRFYGGQRSCQHQGEGGRDNGTDRGILEGS